ncbi:MAG: DUF885 domain-containing protein, partial [Parvularculaceae bacterium]|nr:DUF885 domain-containing protein [Parvularculaceae bacterium]
MRFSAALAAVLLMMTTPAAFAKSASEAFRQVMDDHWASTLENDPILATSVGVRTYDDRLPDPSLAAYYRAVERSKDFLARLKAIDRA